MKVILSDIICRQYIIQLKTLFYTVTIIFKLLSKYFGNYLYERNLHFYYDKCQNNLFKHKISLMLLRSSNLQTNPVWLLKKSNKIAPYRIKNNNSIVYCICIYVSHMELWFKFLRYKYILLLANCMLLFFLLQLNCI